MNEVQMVIFVAMSFLQVHYCVRLAMEERRERKKVRGGKGGKRRKRDFKSNS